MADFTATFEAGVDGATVTTAGGEAAATAWTLVANTPRYSSVQAAHGSLSCEISAVSDQLFWTIPSTTNHYGRIYLYLTADNAGAFNSMIQPRLAAGPLAGIAVYTDRKLCVAVGANTAFSTNPLPLNQWMRIEYHVINSTTVGVVEAKLFLSPDSLAVTETLTLSSQNTSTATDEMGFGDFFGAVAGNFYLDDIVANATSYPGPAVISAENLAPVIYGRGAA